MYNTCVCLLEPDVKAHFASFVLVLVVILVIVVVVFLAFVLVLVVFIVVVAVVVAAPVPRCRRRRCHGRRRGLLSSRRQLVSVPESILLVEHCIADFGYISMRAMDKQTDLCRHK